MYAAKQNKTAAGGEQKVCRNKVKPFADKEGGYYI